MEAIPLFENDRLAVIKSYGKTEADIKFAVHHLSEWARKQHHLPRVPGSSNFTFIHSNH